LGYEVLVKEASDSLTWRRFCHLDLGDRVPDSTTLIKLTHKYGADMGLLNDSIRVITRVVSKLKEMAPASGAGL
jgi:hypothetical protein